MPCCFLFANKLINENILFLQCVSLLFCNRINTFHLFPCCCLSFFSSTQLFLHFYLLFLPQSYQRISLLSHIRSVCFRLAASPFDFSSLLCSFRCGRSLCNQIRFLCLCLCLCFFYALLACFCLKRDQLCVLLCDFCLETNNVVVLFLQLKRL